MKTHIFYILFIIFVLSSFTGEDYVLFKGTKGYSAFIINLSANFASDNEDFLTRIVLDKISEKNEKHIKGKRISVTESKDKSAIDTTMADLNDESFNKRIETNFKRSEPFEILSLSKSANYPSNEVDTLYCEDWILSRNEIKKVIKESEPIVFYYWYYLFEHYACMYEGKIEQNGNFYEFELNAGGWFFIYEGDKLYRFGNFKDQNDKYFLTEPQSRKVIQN